MLSVDLCLEMSVHLLGLLVLHVIFKPPAMPPQLSSGGRSHRCQLCEHSDCLALDALNRKDFLFLLWLAALLLRERIPIYLGNTIKTQQHLELY